MLYSVKMRAARGGAHEQGGSHISGAERIVAEEEIADNLSSLLQRALTHTKGKADFIQMTVEAVEASQIARAPFLPIVSFPVESAAQGREKALYVLEQAGVQRQAARAGLRMLTEMRENMRGAMVLSAETGKRMDQAGQRGIRVTGMDVEDDAGFTQWLQRQDACNLHLREAAVLAAKVAAAPGIVAELCWSDDPEYIAGYVAGKGMYHRISHMKEYGSAQGGRAFFVQAGTDLAALRAYLEEQIVLVEVGGKRNDGQVRRDCAGYQKKRAI